MGRVKKSKTKIKIGRNWTNNDLKLRGRRETAKMRKDKQEVKEKARERERKTQKVYQKKDTREEI